MTKPPLESKESRKPLRQFAKPSSNHHHKRTEDVIPKVDSPAEHLNAELRKPSRLGLFLLGLLLRSLLLAVTLLVLDVFIVDIHGLVDLGPKSRLVGGTSDVSQCDSVGVNAEELTG